jgi:hypothetical protein
MCAPPHHLPAHQHAQTPHIPLCGNRWRVAGLHATRQHIQTTWTRAHALGAHGMASTGPSSQGSHCSQRTAPCWCTTRWTASLWDGGQQQDVGWSQLVQHPLELEHINDLPTTPSSHPVVRSSAALRVAYLL